jgi:hypothetical protein
MGHKAYATTDETGNLLIYGFSLASGISPDLPSLSSKASRPTMPTNSRKIDNPEIMLDERVLIADPSLAPYHFLSTIAKRKEGQLRGPIYIARKSENRKTMLYLKTKERLYCCELHGSRYNDWKLGQKRVEDD